MNITINALTKLRQGPQLYRLRKCFAAVQFDEAEKGRIVFLPKGAKLRVIGESCLNGGLEVVCGRQSYHMFKVDLLGPWTVPMESMSAVSNGIAPVRAAVAVGACA